MNTIDFSPDGKWLATGGYRTGVRLWSMEGGPPKTLGATDGVPGVQFGPGSDFLAAAGGMRVRFWSIPEGRDLLEVELGANKNFTRRGGHLFSGSPGDRMVAFRDWSVLEGIPEVFALHDYRDVTDWDIDASGEWLLTVRPKGVYVTPLRNPSREGNRLIGRHDAKVVSVASHPAEPGFVSADETGELQVWAFSATTGQGHLERTFRATAPRVRFDAADNWLIRAPEAQIDATGSWLVAAPREPATSAVAFVWDIKGPPDSEPIVLRNGDAKNLSFSAIQPLGRWLATTHNDRGILWPLHAKHSRVLRGQAAPYIRVAFTPDGRSLVSSSNDGTVRLWPLSPGEGERSRILMERKTARLGGVGLAIDPSGKYVLVGSGAETIIFLVPVDGGQPRRMPGFREWVGEDFGSMDFSPDGRLAVAVGYNPNLLRIWHLESGTVRVLETRLANGLCGWEERDRGSVSDLRFLAAGRILTVGAEGIRLWDVEGESNREIRPCTPKGAWSYLAIDRGGRRVLVVDVNTDALSSFASYDLETGAERRITNHGNRVSAVALDPSGTIAVTGSLDGLVRVGPVTGEEPHLLYGHTLEITSVAVSPDGKWIASGSQDGTIRLWPMPEGTPFHTLPYDEILERLRGLTNLRINADEGSDTGYRVEIGPFAGWKTLPTW